MQSLVTELDALPDALNSTLTKHHFDRERLLAQADTLRNRGDAQPDNRIAAACELPGDDDVVSLPEPGSAEHAAATARGRALLEAGRVAFCVMAGGMATRMGGVVKGLVEALPGLRFLDFRLAEARQWQARYGRPVPLWLMSSSATDGALRSALLEADAPDSVAVFPQGLNLRLRPDGSLFRDAQGNPSPYATGHGDLVDALRISGLLRDFVAGGGRYVWIANLDNLGATLDETLLGVVAASDRPAAVEVCDKQAGDRGGIPVRCGDKVQVLEEFRLPEGFRAEDVRVFNTNTFLIDAKALLDTPFGWSWFEVEKNVEGQPAVQFERLLQELTAYLDTLYVRVPRDGQASRFLPVKDRAELERRRAELTALARARGVLRD